MLHLGSDTGVLSRGFVWSDQRALLLLCIGLRLSIWSIPLDGYRLRLQESLDNCGALYAFRLGQARRLVIEEAIVINKFPVRLDFHGTESFAEVMVILFVSGQDSEHPLCIWK